MRVSVDRKEVTYDVPPSIFRLPSLYLKDDEPTTQAISLVKSNHTCFTLCAGGDYDRVRYLGAYLIGLHKKERYNKICWHYLNGKEIPTGCTLLILDLVSNEYESKTVNKLVNESKLETLRDLHENFRGIKIILSPLCPKITMQTIRLGYEAQITIPTNSQKENQ
jgi:hypothetical protein